MVRRARKIIIALAISFITAITAMTSVSLCALAEETYYCAFYDFTPIYAEPNTESGILKKLNRNEKIAVLETVTNDTGIYFKVCADDRNGYILKTQFYLYRGENRNILISAKATITRGGEKVYIYSEPNIYSDKIATIEDGTRLKIGNKIDDDFYSITLDGKNAYIQVENVTTELTYYQRLAIVISLVVFVTFVSVLLLCYYGKIRKERERK